MIFSVNVTKSAGNGRLNGNFIESSAVFVESTTFSDKIFGTK